MCLDSGDLLLVRQRFGSGRFDLGQLQVDGFPGVVQRRSLQDDPRRSNQYGNSEDPKKQPEKKITVEKRTF